MEVDPCYSYGLGHLPAARHQPPYPPHPSEDGELWEYFPCPFCYVEVEVPFICNHLQEEHCFDTKNAVIFRGTYWIRWWSQLLKKDDRPKMADGCRMLETTIMQVFAKFGWKFRNRIGM